MKPNAVVQRFDPLLRVGNDAMRKAALAFVNYLEVREARLGGRARGRKAEPAKNFHLAIEALFCNLIVAHAHSPETLLNIPLSNNTLRGSPRYRPIVYGKHFRDLIALMEDLHLIKMVTKGHNVREFRRRAITTIRSTAKLLKLFPPITSIKRNAFIRVDSPEAIVLKDQDGQFLDYIDNFNTRRWRGEMKVINTRLREASISVDSSDDLLDENGFTVRPELRTLRRLWNNGDWKQGGRLYDGFWQTMKREKRLHVIRIDNGPIANVDFCQFNLRLAYALAKATPPRGDLYGMTGNETSGSNWDRLREGRKKLTNAMFNRATPLKQWPGKTSEERKELASCFPKGTTARTATADIRAKHPAIARYFENTRGLGFMRIESDILVATLLSLNKRGITALPLHDAVLVAEPYAKIAKSTLQRESKRRIGTAIPAEIKALNG